MQGVHRVQGLLIQIFGKFAIYFIQGVCTHKANIAAGRTSRLFLREILLLFYLLFVVL